MAKVVIIEEDRRFNDEIAQGLRELGYEYIQLYNVEEVHSLNQSHDIGIVIMSVKLSHDRTFSIMNERRLTNIPVILAKTPEVKTRTSKMRSFEIIELMARVQATFGKMKCAEGKFQIGNNVMVDLKDKLVEMNGIPIELTKKEFELLETLIINRNINMSREKILEMVWSGECDGNSRTVDVHIRKLRQKLNLEDYIITVYKLGYKLKV